MSEQEMLVLSTRERDRLKVLHEVEKGHLKRRAAAAQLKISDRWVRELLRRVRAQGDRGVVHGLRGRVSNRRIAEKVRLKALKLVPAKYGDFGPTLAGEYLAKQGEIQVSKETLRQWLLAAGLRRAKRRQVEEVRLAQTFISKSIKIPIRHRRSALPWPADLEGPFYDRRPFASRFS